MFGLVVGVCLNCLLVISGKCCICVFIFGVNGFIGNYLIEWLLNEENYEVYGMDIGSNVISWFLFYFYFYFVEGDISIYLEWIEYYVKNVMLYCCWQ